MNKLMARIVAVVLAVMMLGTVSFAANLNDANNQIPANTEETDEFSEVWTVKATAENGTIVALYQGTEAPGAIAIDPAKLGNSKYVTVEYSGKNGNGIKTVTVGVNKKDTGSVTVADTITIGENEDAKTYSDVAYVEHTFNVAGKFVNKLGYILKDMSKANPKEVEVAYGTTSFSGEGDITFGLVIYAVPDEADIVATHFINYVAE